MLYLLKTIYIQQKQAQNLAPGRTDIYRNIAGSTKARSPVMWAETQRVLKETEYIGEPYQSARTTPCHQISLLQFPPTHSVTEIHISQLPQRGEKNPTNFKHAEASWWTRCGLSWRKTIKWSACRADGLLLPRHVFQRRNR